MPADSSSGTDPRVDRGRDMTLEGIHEAHLIQVECVYNRIYGRGIEFLWRLEGSGQTIRSRLWMVTHEGRPNTVAIKATQRWARGWDGRNPLWFVDRKSVV